MIYESEFVIRLVGQQCRRAHAGVVHSVEEPESLRSSEVIGRVEELATNKIAHTNLIFVDVLVSVF